MAETLGSLCDKLTIVKLKQWHTEDGARLENLAQQAEQLSGEIDAFFDAAVSGRVEQDRLRFASHKVFDGHVEGRVAETIGQLFADLAHINCELWHEQEKVYEVQKRPESQIDAVSVMGRLGELNLHRTRCIDALDQTLSSAVASRAAAEEAG